APMSAPLPPDMASPVSEPRKTMPPRLMAVVENRVSRDRCVMIPSKSPQRRTSLLRPGQQFCRTYALTPRMSPCRHNWSQFTSLSPRSKTWTTDDAVRGFDLWGHYEISLVSGAAAWPLAARAQQPDQIAASIMVSPRLAGVR